jgi:hypothetical protein
MNTRAAAALARTDDCPTTAVVEYIQHQPRASAPVDPEQVFHPIDPVIALQRQPPPRRGRKRFIAKDAENAQAQNFT